MLASLALQATDSTVDRKTLLGLMVDSEPVEVIDDAEEDRVVSGEDAGLGRMVEALEAVFTDMNEDNEARFSEIDILVELLLSKESILSQISCVGSWAWSCSGSFPRSRSWSRVLSPVSSPS